MRVLPSPFRNAKKCSSVESLYQSAEAHTSARAPAIFDSALQLATTGYMSSSGCTSYSPSASALIKEQTVLRTSSSPICAVETERLRRQIEAHLRGTQRGRTAQLELIVTNNHSTMISVRRRPGTYRLRLHRMFLTAELHTLRALGRYVTDNDQGASAELSDFIDAHQAQIPSRPVAEGRSVRIDQEGQHHDLRQLFEDLNQRYFAGEIEARITWGRRQRRDGRPRRHRSLKLGSYSVEDRLIRIHPTLDQPSVPGFFVEWIVYHEMLHQKHPIPIIDGRRCFHTPAFLAEERLFDEYERACQWERRNLHRLLVF